MYCLVLLCITKCNNNQISLLVQASNFLIAAFAECWSCIGHTHGTIYNNNNDIFRKLFTTIGDTVNYRDTFVQRKYIFLQLRGGTSPLVLLLPIPMYYQHCIRSNFAWADKVYGLGLYRFDALPDLPLWMKHKKYCHKNHNKSMVTDYNICTAMYICSLIVLQLVTYVQPRTYVA